MVKKKNLFHPRLRPDSIDVATHKSIVSLGSTTTIPSVGKRRSNNEHARVIRTSARHVKRHDTSRQGSRPSQRLSVACDIPSIQVRGLLQEQAVEATAAKNHQSVDKRGDWVCAMPIGHWEARLDYKLLHFCT
jgi:hypothetical protein